MQVALQVGLKTLVELHLQALNIHVISCAWSMWTILSSTQEKFNCLRGKLIAQLFQTSMGGVLSSTDQVAMVLPTNQQKITP